MDTPGVVGGSFWGEFGPLTLFVTLAFFCVLVFGWVGASHMEARAYERVTGVEVSTVDALWLNLRVDCDNPQQGTP